MGEQRLHDGSLRMAARSLVAISALATSLISGLKIAFMRKNSLESGAARRMQMSWHVAALRWQKSQGVLERAIRDEIGDLTNYIRDKLTDANNAQRDREH
jgi:hypothetical protein